MYKKKINIIFLLICTCCIAAKGLVSSAIELPDVLNPGVIGKDNIESFEYNDYYEEEKEEKNSKNSLKLDKNLKPVQYNVDITKNQQANLDQRNPDFFINKIIITGNTVISDKELRRITKKSEGKKSSNK